MVLPLRNVIRSIVIFHFYTMKITMVILAMDVIFPFKELKM